MNRRLYKGFSYKRRDRRLLMVAQPGNENN